MRVKVSNYTKKEQKHEFAVFSKQELVVKDKKIILADSVMVHRISNVLRLKVGEQIIAFDDQQAYTLELQDISKKNIITVVKNTQKIEFLRPSITVALPLLKLENLEQAVYNAVELGATEIQLLSTAKSYHIKQAVLEKRLPALLQAAAELSKNFAIPKLTPPRTLESFLDSCRQDTNTTLVFFDPEGKSLSSCLQQLSVKSTNSFFLLVGPEGDLTMAEKEKVQKAGAIFCALTPTVLRAFQAMTLGLGTFRCWLDRS